MQPQPTLNRRRFLQSSASAAAGAALIPQLASAAVPKPFSFVLLGDLHFDKLEHHDMAWLERNKAGDLSQIRNYSRLTAEIMPRLFATVRETVADLGRSGSARPAFVVQVGDLVEGLCGNEKLAALQDHDALAFVRQSELGAPFVFTKGNHDVTGDGATDAFKHVCEPFLSEQLRSIEGGGRMASANYTVEQGEALFCFFDAYDRQSLDWLEAALAKRTARYCFVVIHPPVVPYGARATWHLYSSSKEKHRREKLLELLGKQNAFVLGGHIHRFNALTRTTPRGGKFVQLAVSSVINAASATAKTELYGIGQYNGDQIRVELAHSPATEKERRAVYDAEKPFVTKFEYADLPGYAVVTVDVEQVTATIYSGVSRNLWRTVNLTEMMQG